VIEDAELGVLALRSLLSGGTLRSGKGASMEDERIEQRQPEARANEREQEQQGLKPVTAGTTHGSEGTRPARRAGSPRLTLHRGTPPPRLDARPPEGHLQR
jgi:hypothetical protein